MVVVSALEALSSLNSTCSDTNQSHSHWGYCHQYFCLRLMENMKTAILKIFSKLWSTIIQM